MIKKMKTPATSCGLSVLIPDGENWNAVKVIRCLGQVPQNKMYVLSTSRSPLAKFSRYCAGCRHYNDNGDWVGAIKDMVRRSRIDVILPATFNGVELLSRNRWIMSEFVALSAVPDFGSLQMVHDKWDFYLFAKENGFPTATSVLIGSPQEVDLDLLNIDLIEYPALLKPVSEGGGCGIVKVLNRGDFGRAWTSKGLMGNRKYILQSYIPGIDLCLQVFCRQGEILNYTLQRSTCSADNYFGPQRVMDFVEDQAVVDMARKIVAAMNWEGIACIDFRIDSRDSTIKLIEVNPRFGQAVLGSLVAGVNFPLIACLDAVGAELPNTQYQITKYAHPAVHGKMLVSRLTGKGLPVDIKWQQSGLRFTAADPLPEMVDASRRMARKLKHLLVSK